ncbi:MAG TPA: serine hydrolase [bacterium]|nr:serine hydrolase [bacterium]
MTSPPVLQGIQRLAAQFSGALGLWSHSLISGETIAWNAEDVFPSASTIKLPILYEVYRQAGDKRFHLMDTRTVEATDVVPGSGILKDLTPGVTLSIRDLATLMIVVSDNTSANLLIDLIGIEAVNRAMKALGLHATVLGHKFFRAPEGAVPNSSTPVDLGRLLVQISRHKVLTPAACEEMLRVLRQQHYTDHITRKIVDYDGFLEAGVEPVVTVASKSGAIRGTRNDVALVERRNSRYVIAMMTQDCADRRFYVDNEAAVLLANVSALVDEHWQGQAKGAGARLT